LPQVKLAQGDLLRVVLFLPKPREQGRDSSADDAGYPSGECAPDESGNRVKHDFPAL